MEHNRKLQKMNNILLPMGGSAYGIPTKDTYSVPFEVSLADPIIFPICNVTLGFKSSPRQQPNITSTILKDLPKLKNVPSRNF